MLRAFNSCFGARSWSLCSHRHAVIINLMIILIRPVVQTLCSPPHATAVGYWHDPGPGSQCAQALGLLAVGTVASRAASGWTSLAEL